MNQKENLIWFAGLFEGEGYISATLRQKDFNCCFGLEMTDLDIINRAERVMKSLVINPDRVKRHTRKRGYNKRSYVVQVQQKENFIEIIKKIAPFLGERRNIKINEILLLAEQHSASKIPACGTLAGNSRHYRLNEKVCEPCLQAKRDYQNAKAYA